MRRPWLFDLGAFLYGVMTAQETWRASCARLVSFFPPHTGNPHRLRVLDLGCGPGVSTLALAREQPEAFVAGLDLAPRMLVEAKRYAQLERPGVSVDYVLADAAYLPFADGCWDMITGHSFLYLVNDRTDVVAEAFRALRSGGRIASMEPHAQGVLGQAVRRHWRELRYVISIVFWRPYSRAHIQFTDASFRELLKRAGFQDCVFENTLDGLGIIGCGVKP